MKEDHTTSEQIKGVSLLIITGLFSFLVFLCFKASEPTKESGTITFQKEYADTVAVR